MSGDTPGRENRGAAPSDESALSARLKRLGERLEHSSPSRAAETGPAPRSATDHSGFARGFPLSSELWAGAVVRTGLRWLVRRGVGTFLRGGVRRAGFGFYG